MNKNNQHHKQQLQEYNVERKSPELNWSLTEDQYFDLDL